MPPTQSTSRSEPNWERLAVRMIHKVCPIKETHAEIDGHCPQCGLSPDDYARFIVGDEGEADMSERKTMNPSTDEQVLALALSRLVAANPERAREVAGYLRYGNVSVVELRASDLLQRMVDVSVGPLRHPGLQARPAWDGIGERPDA